MMRLFSGNRLIASIFILLNIEQFALMIEMKALAKQLVIMARVTRSFPHSLYSIFAYRRKRKPSLLTIIEAAMAHDYSRENAISLIASSTPIAMVAWDIRMENPVKWFCCNQSPLHIKDGVRLKLSRIK